MIPYTTTEIKMGKLTLRELSEQHHEQQQADWYKKMISDKVLSSLSDTQITQEIKRFADELQDRIRDRNSEQCLRKNEICLSYSSQLYKVKHKLSLKFPRKDLRERQLERWLNVNKNPGVK
tara:strand:- start:19 stop:381 length:363 start_codon:yes stop_codon:yes gene_type:complete